jgi:hypothetical protein
VLSASPLEKSVAITIEKLKDNNNPAQEIMELLFLLFFYLIKNILKDS